MSVLDNHVLEFREYTTETRVLFFRKAMKEMLNGRLSYRNVWTSALYYESKTA